MSSSSLSPSSAAIKEADELNLKLSRLHSKLKDRRTQSEESKRLIEEKIGRYVEQIAQLKFINEAQLKQIIDLEKKLAFHQNNAEIRNNNNGRHKKSSSSHRLKSPVTYVGTNTISFSPIPTVEITSPVVSIEDDDNDNTIFLNDFSPIISKLKTHMERQKSNYLQMKKFAQITCIQSSLESINCSHCVNHLSENDSNGNARSSIDSANSSSNNCCLKNQSNLNQLLEILKNHVLLPSPIPSPSVSPVASSSKSKPTQFLSPNLSPNISETDLNRSSASTLKLNLVESSATSPVTERSTLLLTSGLMLSPEVGVQIEQTRDLSPKQPSSPTITMTMSSPSTILEQDSMVNESIIRRGTMNMDIDLFGKICASRQSSAPKETSTPGTVSIKASSQDFCSEASAPVPVPVPVPAIRRLKSQKRISSEDVPFPVHKQVANLTAAAAIDRRLSFIAKTKQLIEVSFPRDPYLNSVVTFELNTCHPDTKICCKIIYYSTRNAVDCEMKAWVEPKQVDLNSTKAITSVERYVNYFVQIHFLDKDKGSLGICKWFQINSKSGKETNGSSSPGIGVSNFGKEFLTRSEWLNASWLMTKFDPKSGKYFEERVLTMTAKVQSMTSASDTGRCNTGQNDQNNNSGWQNSTRHLSMSTSQKLARLQQLRGKLNTSVIFKCGPQLDCHFKIYETILSYYSPIWKSMFDPTSDLKEHKSKEVLVPYVSRKAMQAFYNFMHGSSSGIWLEDVELNLELLEFGEKYMIIELVQRCTENLVETEDSHFNMVTALNTMEAGQYYDIKPLEERAFQWIESITLNDMEY